MQRIQGNSQQPSTNPNHRRLQLVASQPINLCRTLPIIGGESILIGSIFDVDICQILQKISKI